jgi:hypothetical protein
MKPKPGWSWRAFVLLVALLFSVLAFRNVDSVVVFMAVVLTVLLAAHFAGRLRQSR